jgi:hypothetical protein
MENLPFDRPPELTDRQVLAAQGIASGMSYKVAAKFSHSSIEGIRMWRKRADFNELVWNYQQEIFHQSFGATTKALPACIEKLQEIVESNDPEVNTASKIQAIKLIIDTATRSYETRAIERRIELLEGNARKSFIEIESARKISPGTS